MPLNYVVVLDRCYNQEDAHLAAGILSGCLCGGDSDEDNCRKVGEAILHKLAHSSDSIENLSTANVLPTPEIVATLKKLGYVVGMQVHSRTQPAHC